MILGVFTLAAALTSAAERTETCRVPSTVGTGAASQQLEEGSCLLKTGKYDAAAAVLRSFTEHNAGNPQGWRARAEAELFSKHFSDAKVSVDHALALQSDSADAYTLLGKIDLELGDHQGAYQAWLRAKDLDPKNGAITYYIGRMFFEADFPKEAAGWFRETLNRAPHHVPAMTYLALCAERLKMEKTALELYPAAIQESKRQRKPYPWAFLDYAKLLRELGRDEDARRVLEEAEQLCPEAHALTALGQLLASQNETDRAENVLRRAVALDPSIPDAHYRLSMILRKKGQPQEADAELHLYQETKQTEDQRPKVQAMRKGV